MQVGCILTDVDLGCFGASVAEQQWPDPSSSSVPYTAKEACPALLKPFIGSHDALCFR